MEKRELTKRTAIVLPFAIALIVVLLDQVTKLLAIKYLVPYQALPVIPNLLSFTLAFNDRAAFSLGGSFTWIFTLISSIALLVLIYVVPRFKTLGWLVLGGFAIGGVTGNLVDRLTKAPGFPNGHVVDFIQIPFDFPVFNIADMAISLTAVVVAFRVIRGQKLGGRS